MVLLPIRGCEGCVTLGAEAGSVPEGGRGTSAAGPRWVRSVQALGGELMATAYGHPGHRSDHDPNPAARVACLLGGGALALLGLRRGGPLGVGLALAGGALAMAGAASRGEEDLLRAGLGGLERALPAGATAKVRQDVTIARPRAEVWRFVRDFAGFPRWASHVESVTVSGDGRSHWVVRGPGGARLEWDSEIEAETPGERVSWQSLPEGDVRNAGVLSLHDAPGGGTEIRLRLAYDAPAGVLGHGLARLLGDDPDLQAAHDLRRLKELLETGTAGPSDGRLPPAS
jgi:uncharacterized membrane protein